MSAAMLFLLLLLFLIIGIPIAGGIGAASLIYMKSAGISFYIAVQRMFSAVDSTTLIALPAFIIAGNLMDSGGLAKRLVRFFDVLFGWLPGGLAVCDIIAAAFFGTISGSSVATTAAIGGMLIPEMKERNYPPSFTAAVSAAGGVLGGVIPPSMGIVIYGSVVGLSITTLFKAAFGTGIFMAGGAAIYCILYGVKHGIKGSGHHYSLKDFLIITKDALLAILSPVIIIGGIFSGIMTPTESAVVSIIYAFLIGMFVYKELDLKKCWKVMVKSAVQATGILLITCFANLYGWIVASERVPQLVLSFITGITNNKYFILILANIFLFFAGMFMSGSAVIYIAAPILAPLASGLGMNPYQFGTMFLNNGSVGHLTPPFGQCLFTGSMITGEPVAKVAKALLPFILIYAGIVILEIFIPMALIFV